MLARVAVTLARLRALLCPICPAIAISSAYPARVLLARVKGIGTSLRAEVPFAAVLRHVARRATELLSTLSTDLDATNLRPRLAATILRAKELMRGAVSESPLFFIRLFATPGAWHRFTMLGARLSLTAAPLRAVFGFSEGVVSQATTAINLKRDDRPANKAGLFHGVLLSTQERQQGWGAGVESRGSAGSKSAIALLHFTTPEACR
jgi:hypothetical protein